MGRHEIRHMGDGGEIVIPKDMRERLGIAPGDEVTFEEREGEVAILRRQAAKRGPAARTGSKRRRTSSARERRRI